MSEELRKPCPRCSGEMQAGDDLCPRCLLGAASGQDDGAPEDRLFEQALALEVDERIPFLREATRGDSDLFEAVEMLLKGYAEAGGDALTPAPVDPSEPEARWAVGGGEEPGAVIDRFRLIRRIGEGGMGSVWEAEQSAPVRRTVALKVIKLGMDTREVVARFRRERQLLALMSHPHIAQVYEAGATVMGRPYFAMELVDGEPITTRCKASNAELLERLQLFRDVCSAVEHAHQKGVIHRDLKPSNILVDGHGRVKIIDFGVARSTQGSQGTLHTQGTQVLGTPVYMSPEQARTGGEDIDTRTDVYSLGVVLYELLTGTLPLAPERFAGASPAEVMRILEDVELPAPSTRVSQMELREGRFRDSFQQLRSVLRGDLDRIVMKAVRKDRDQRYQSAAALGDDIRRYLEGEPVTAVPPTLSYRASKFVSRHRTAVGAAVMVSLSLVVATVVSLREAVRANHAQREAAFTLADMYTRTGLAAAEDGDAARAGLWFANAAMIAADDPERQLANRRRHAAWRRETAVPVRAFDNGLGGSRGLSWNPDHPTIIVTAGPRDVPDSVWDLASDRLWKPKSGADLYSAVWSPSGDRVAAYDGEAVVVVGYPSGEELARWSEAEGAPPLALSPDGRRIAVGGYRPFLWDWAADEKVFLPSDSTSPHRFQFSADGEKLMVQSGNFLGVCSTENVGAFLHPRVEFYGFSPAAFLDGGARYVVVEHDGSVVVRDASSGEVAERYAGERDDYLTAVSSDGRFLSRAKRPVIDRKAGGATDFPFHANAITGGTFDSSGSLFVSVGHDTKARLWSLPDGEPLGAIGVHQHTVGHTAFSPDGDLLATSQYGVVRIWRLPSAPEGRALESPTASRAVLSGDGRFVALSGGSRMATQLLSTRVVDVSTGQPVGPEITPGGLIVDARFSPDAEWLAVLVCTTPDRESFDLRNEDGSGNLQIWDFREGRMIGDPIPMPAEPRGLAIHPSGRWIAAACNGQGVEYDLETGELGVIMHNQKRSLPYNTLNNGACAYSPVGSLLVFYGYYEYLHLWDRENARELIEPFRRDQNTFDFDFHGSTLAGAVVTKVSRVEFLDQHTGNPVVSPIPYSNWPLVSRFSPDGQVLLTGGRDSVARIWDWRTGRSVCPELRHAGEVIAGAFIPRGPWVVTGGHGGVARFWDYLTGLPISPPVDLGGIVFDLNVTPDSRTLLTTGATVELLDLQSLLPEPDLSPADARLLAEVESAAEVHSGGGIVPLTTVEWLERWHAFREIQPDFPDHRISE